MALWRVALGVAGVFTSVFMIGRKIVKDLQQRVEDVNADKHKLEQKVSDLETQIGKLENSAITQNDMDAAFERQTKYIQQIIESTMEPIRRELQQTHESMSRLEKRVDGVISPRRKPLDE